MGRETVGFFAAFVSEPEVVDVRFVAGNSLRVVVPERPCEKSPYNSPFPESEK